MEEGGELTIIPQAEVTPEVVDRNAYGYCDGSTFHFTSFPDLKNGDCQLASGVQCQQTLGSVTISFALQGENVDVTSDVLEVEMSSFMLRVTVIGDRRRELSTVSGRLYGSIRRYLSWWNVEDSDSGRTLVLHLSKLRHGSWKKLWNDQPIDHRQRQHFGWRVGQKEPEDPERELQVVEHGIQHNEKNLQKRIQLPDVTQLCTGIEFECEDEDYVYLLLHFDEVSLEYAQCQLPLEHMFSVDVESKYLQVGLRAKSEVVNSNLICWGELHDDCAHLQCKWEFKNSMRRKLPSGNSVQNPGFHNPALRLLIKKMSKREWGRVFTEMKSSNLSLPRDRPHLLPVFRNELYSQKEEQSDVDCKDVVDGTTSEAEARRFVTHYETRQDHDNVYISLRMHNAFIDDEDSFNVEFALTHMKVLCDVDDEVYNVYSGNFGGQCVVQESGFNPVRKTSGAGSLTLELVVSKMTKGQRWPFVFTPKWDSC